MREARVGRARLAPARGLLDGIAQRRREREADDVAAGRQRLNDDVARVLDVVDLEGRGRLRRERHGRAVERPAHVALERQAPGRAPTPGARRLAGHEGSTGSLHVDGKRRLAARSRRREQDLAVHITHRVRRPARVLARAPARRVDDRVLEGVADARPHAREARRGPVAERGLAAHALR